MKSTIHSRIAWLPAVSLLVWIVAIASNVFAMPVPGTSIVNVGTAEYTDENGESHTVISNPAYVIVAEALAVDLEEDQFFPATPGQPVYYRHRLTNIGNVDDSYTLSIEQISGDAGDFSSIRIFLDINEDGLPSAGEPEIDETNVISPQAFIYLVIEARVPANAVLGSEYSLRVTATSNTDASVNDANLDGVDITDGPILLLNKSSNRQCTSELISGDTLTYSVSFSSVGPEAPEAQSVIVDGIEQFGVLIVDELPEQLVLINEAPEIAPRQASLLVQRELDADDQWLAFDSWNGIDAVDKIAALYAADQMETNESGSFSFTTQVSETAEAGEFENVVIADLDNDSNFESVSNKVCNYVAKDVQFELTPNRSIRIPESAQVTPVEFAHTLSNTGGRDDTYSLEVTPSTIDSGDLTDITIYIDNGDGVFDEADDQLYTGTPIFVASDDEQLLFVAANVPAGFVTGDSLTQTLVATSQTDTDLVESNTETVTFRPNGVAFELVKTTSRFCELVTENEANPDTADRLLPLDTFTYGITFTNHGSEAPAAREYNVDGAVAIGVLLQDTLPYSLRLVAGQTFESSLNGEVIVLPYDNYEQNAWIRYSNWNGTDLIGRIAVLYSAESLGSDQTDSFEFDVQVVETATSQTEFYNRAFFDYDEDGVQDAQSNQVCNLVSDNSDPDTVVPEAEIRFLTPEPNLYFNRTGELPEHAVIDDFVDTESYRVDTAISYNAAFDGVFIEVNSTSIDETVYEVLPNGKRQILVEVESDGTGDTARVWLRETEAGSGKYRSIRVLALSLENQNNGGVCPTDQYSDIDFTAEVTGECTLQTVQPDSLIVTILNATGLEEGLQDLAIVDPTGYVFDSQTLEPVAGAEVAVCRYIVDLDAATLATVDDQIENDLCGDSGELAINPFSPSREPFATQITQSDGDNTNTVFNGEYVYDQLEPGDYFLTIVPPTGYIWPSNVTPAELNGVEPAFEIDVLIESTNTLRDDALIVNSFSYGVDGFAGQTGVFTLDAANPLEVVDIPLDPITVDLQIANDCSVEELNEFNPSDENRLSTEFTIPIRYQVSFFNDSPSEFDRTRTISVDGNNQTGVLIESDLAFEVSPVLDADAAVYVDNGFINIRDPQINLPAGDVNDVAFLYQTYDSGASVWFEYTPGSVADLDLETLSNISKLGLLLPTDSLPSNQSGNQVGTFTFDVIVPNKVNITRNAVLANTVSVDLDGNGVAEEEARTFCIALDGEDPELRFVAPTNTIRAAILRGEINQTQSNASPIFANDDEFVDISQYIISDLTEDGYTNISDDVYVEMRAFGLPRQAFYDPGTGINYADGRRRVVVEVSALASAFSFESTSIAESGKTGGSSTSLSKLNAGQTRDTLEIVLQETFEGSGVFRSVSPLILSVDEATTGLCGDVYDDLSTTVNDISYWDSLSDTTGFDDQANCTLKTVANDDLKAFFAYQVDIDDNNQFNAELDDFAVVDPFSTVFKSVDGTPVFEEEGGDLSSGVEVTVYNQDGTPATHPLTGEELVQAVDSGSRFRFPFLNPGTYYLDLNPPVGSLFPSILSINEIDARAVGFDYNLLPASFGVDGPADSEGVRIANAGLFTVGDNFRIVGLEENEPMRIDIPIDYNAAGELVIEKTASVTEVEMAGLVEYTIVVKNIGTADLSDVVIQDKLPYGFKYIPQTTRIDDYKVADPDGGLGPQLTFTVGDLSALGSSDGADEVSISYYLQATAGAVDSDGINIAQAFGSAGFRDVVSNVSRAEVELVQRGVMSDKAYIFGKVYVDVDCNDLQTEGEWPIGAVKLYMEDGTFAITDENGQYSLYGIDPGLHVIKVDPLTLPEGLTLKPIDNRHGADGDSRFVDLTTSEYHRADFAVACPEPSVMDEIHQQIIQRNQSINANWMLDEAARFDPTREQNNRTVADANGELGQGIIGANNAGSDILTGVQQSPITSTVYNVADEITLKDDAPTPMPLTQDMVKMVTAAQAKKGQFLWPENDTSVYGRFMVVVRSGVSPTLYVNGQPISNEKLGEQFINKRERAQVMAWYGISLETGENLVEVKGKDPFGNMRVLASKKFFSPGIAERIEIEALDKTLAADGGRSAARVALRVLDKNDRPARGVHFITLEVSDGIWAEEDIQDQTMGFQTRVRGGETIMHLRSSEFTGEVLVKATTDEFEAETTIDFVASNRSLVVSGVASAGYQYGTINSDGFAPTDQNEGLDENGIESRAALFMKGKIKGGMHLTLSYDTDKDSDTELLRDINPNEYYPIPGDNSVRGFEAQSRSKLYAKLEKDRHSLLWGDYVTDSQSQARDVARVSRTLTGVRGIYDDGKLKAQVFAAQEEDAFNEIFLAANGTAMLYQIPNGNIVYNSEVIEIVTYDRESNNLNTINQSGGEEVQPSGIELERESLQRFIDYTVDYVTGDIRFTRSIPSLDEDGNPNLVRIAYNRENGGDKELVAGVRAEYQLTEKLTVGGSHTQDENPTSGTKVSGVFAAIDVDDSTQVNVSVGTMSHNNGTESGKALLAEARKTWGNNGNTTVTYGRADQGFTNSGGGVASDNEQLRLNHSQQITSNLNLNGEFLNSGTLSGDDTRRNTSLTADYRLKEWTVRAGASRSETESSGSSDSSDSLILGLGRGFDLFGRKGSVNLEHQKEIGDQARQRWTTDVGLQVHEKAKLYGRYEQTDTILSGGFGDSQKQTSGSIGFESTWIPSTTVYNEYRMRGATDGQNLESATGIRGDIELKPGLRLNPSFEFIETMEGTTDNGSIAASIGLTDSQDDNSRKSLRLESRLDESRHYYGVDASYVARMNLNWSSFIREDFSYTENVGSDNDLQHILTVGLAHRPRLTNEYHSLWLYQWKLEENTTSREVHLFSTHQNWQMNEDLVLSGRFGIKFEEYDLLDIVFDTNVAMIDGRLIYDLTRRIDFDIHGGLLTTNGIDEMRYAFGLGLNFLLNRNLRVHAGYNFVGFEEHDLDGEGYNAHGFNIGLQYKFDEQLFDGLAAE